jgi:hypothetical protein
MTCLILLQLVTGIAAFVYSPTSFPITVPAKDSTFEYTLFASLIHAACQLLLSFAFSLVQTFYSALCARYISYSNCLSIKLRAWRELRDLRT